MLTRADVNRARREAREGKREVVRSDGGVPGLALRVQAPGKDGSEGKAAFYLRYRRPADRKQVWREITRWSDGDDTAKLAEVRKIATQWNDELRQGIDPEERERQERAAAEEAKREAEAKGVTVREVYDAFAALISDPKSGDRDRGDEVAIDFRIYILPVWGNRPIGSIKRSEVVARLTQIRDGKVPHPTDDTRMMGTPIVAKRVHKNLTRLFNFQQVRSDDFVSPMVKGLVNACGLPSTTDMERDRALCAKDDRGTDDELIAFWRATAERTTFTAMVRAALLTGQRIWAEVAAMRRADIDASGVWHIDPERYKTDIKHEVPLPPSTLAFIRSQPAHSPDQVWVFSNRGASHLARENCIEAKERLDMQMLAELREMAKARGDDPRKIALPPWQLRDLRRTARTLMSRIGVDDAIAEATLGHKGAKIERTYNRDKRTALKREALAKLAAEIERIVSPADTAKAA